MSLPNFMAIPSNRSSRISYVIFEHIIPKTRALTCFYDSLHSSGKALEPGCSSAAMLPNVMLGHKAVSIPFLTKGV